MSRLIESILEHKSRRSSRYLEKIFMENGIPWRQ